MIIVQAKGARKHSHKSVTILSLSQPFNAHRARRPELGILSNEMRRDWSSAENVSKQSAHCNSSALRAVQTIERCRIHKTHMVSSTHEHHDYVRRRKFRPLPVTREMVEADWTPRGFKLVEVVRPGGSALEGGTEDRDELIVVVEGCMEFMVGPPNAESESQGRGLGPGQSQMCTLEPGDELFVPAHTPFEALVPQEVESVRLFIGVE